MSEDKPIKIPLEEYRIPLQKVKIIGKGGTSGKDLMITEMENLTVIQKRKIKSKNPNKKTLFKLANKLEERIEFAYYPDNDFINVFVNGGVHDSRFIISLRQLKELYSILVYYYDKLYKKHDKNEEKIVK